jgi:hypothetical protein
MEIGIIGLPRSGKTTLFNALTRGKAETGAYAPTSPEPNIGVAKVPDPRLAQLERIFKPKKTIPAEVKYVDVAAPRAKGEGLSGPLLTYLSRADALLHVVRAFTDLSVPHVEGSVFPERDTATMNLELIFADLAILERRLKRIGDSLKGAKPGERDALHREQALLARIKAELERESPLREQELTEEESRILANYQFLTAKPLLVVLNIGEEQLPRALELEQELASRYPRLPVTAVCGKLEMELSQLSEAEAMEFRSALGVSGSALEQVIKLSYQHLGLISFFTTASAELKAWTVPRNTPAPRAAGKVHSDMERGFIRAEVISYDDLVKCGGIGEARKRGLLRLEGKNYLVQDGDIITFLFSV